MRSCGLKGQNGLDVDGCSVSLWAYEGTVALHVHAVRACGTIHGDTRRIKPNPSVHRFCSPRYGPCLGFHITLTPRRRTGKMFFKSCGGSCGGMRACG